MNRLLLTVVALALLAPAPGRAAGGHDAVGCVGCHGVKKASLDTAAFCLQCHASREEGGRGVRPVSAHGGHPLGALSIDPRAATVPPEHLRGGRIECLSCHDPHPANTKFAYLRIDTGRDGRQQDAFCAVCHPAKTDLTPRTFRPEVSPP